MNRNYNKLFSVLLLVTPSMFFAMQKPRSNQASFLSSEEITRMFTMPEQLEHEQLDEQARLFEAWANIPEARANIEAIVAMVQMSNNPTPETNNLLLQLQAEAMREQARRAIRITPSIEEIVEEAPVVSVNTARAQTLADVPAATPNPTRTERLQAYWNNLHPAVKAGVVGVGAIATCSAAKKLYDFVNKRK